jgi:hypothetical protein
MEYEKQELSKKSEKMTYTAPQLTIYGTISQITLMPGGRPPIKNKAFGPADDVLVSQQAILHNVS